MTLPEVTNSISDEMLVKWLNERNTRIYTGTGEKKTYQLRGYQHIARGWG
jgi:hypothetical protein